MGGCGSKRWDMEGTKIKASMLPSTDALQIKRSSIQSESLLLVSVHQPAAAILASATHSKKGSTTMRCTSSTREALLITGARLYRMPQS